MLNRFGKVYISIYLYISVNTNVHFYNITEQYHIDANLDACDEVISCNDPSSDILITQSHKTKMSQNRMSQDLRRA